MYCDCARAESSPSQPAKAKARALINNGVNERKNNRDIQGKLGTMLLTVVESKVKVTRGGEVAQSYIASVVGAGLYSAFSGGELRPFPAFAQCSMPTYEYSCEKCGKTFE